MISKKPYIKPEITRIVRDSSIVLLQVSDPDPQGSGAAGSSKKSPDEPFASPFRDKPFD
ncbi:MAG: hypothetical protein LLG13_12470 [Bacteroidales bacterium]|nr:hypothetical protein [Bacteroidales bacterium]